MTEKRLRHLSVKDDLDHAVINNGSAVLVSVNQRLRAGTVYEPRDTRGKRIDEFNGILGEDRIAAPSIFQLPVDIAFS